MRTLILIPMLLLLGCQTPSKHPQLADQFGDCGYIIQHHEVMFAHAKLKNEAQRRRVVDELDRCLRKRQPLPDFPNSPGVPSNRYARIRNRDFWALVLSEYTRGSLQIYTWESDAERERKIESFLRARKS